jgi:hypothetical protein
MEATPKIQTATIPPMKSQNQKVLSKVDLAVDKTSLLTAKQLVTPVSKRMPHKTKMPVRLTMTSVIPSGKLKTIAKGQITNMTTVLALVTFPRNY